MNTPLQINLPDGEYVRNISRPAIRFGLFLFAIDLIFLALHFAYNFGYLSDLMFHVEMEGAYAEWFQYFKFLLATLILFYVAARSSSLLRFALGCLTGFLLFEDTMGYHEDFYLIGQQIYAFESIGPFDPINIWEMIYDAVAGIALLGLITFSILRTRDKVLQQRALGILFAFCMIAFCGVVIDNLHAAFQDAGNRGWEIYFESLLGIAEDWGEMIFATLLVALIVDDAYRALYGQRRPARRKDPAPALRGKQSVS